MLRLLLRSARSRLGRTAALLCAIVVATSGFTVLTGTTNTARLAMTQFVEANARGTYDILVRPRGSREPLETDSGLVRPNHLNSQYGGITEDQWRAIERTPGVDVAAPVATIGYTSVLATAQVDVTAQLDRSLTRQVVRIRPTWIGDNGLSRATEDVARFVYITRRPLAVPEPGPDGSGLLAPDNSVVSADRLASLGCAVPYPLLELSEAGTWVPVCGTWFLSLNDTTSMLDLNQAEFAVYQALDDGSFLDFRRVVSPALAKTDRGDRTKPVHTDRVVFDLRWPLWFPIAAVDPAAEAKLAGLDRAIVSGAYLPADVPARSDGRLRTVPIIAASRTATTESLSAVTDRLPGDAVAGAAPAQLLQRLSSAGATTQVRQEFTAADEYRSVLNTLDAAARLDVTLESGSPSYTVTGPDSLSAQTRPTDSSAWQTEVSEYGEVARGAAALQPTLATDLSFRPLGPTAVRKIEGDLLDAPHVVKTGEFDPALTKGESALASVPMETYYAPEVTGADAESRRALGDTSLSPTNNPAGYLVAPPAMITTLQVASRLLDRDDLISAVRVRVAYVTGADPASNERVRLVAETIAAATGLDVDVTIGSSIRPLTVQLPAGSYGRPALSVHEGWSKKGVALSIVRATDRKSLLLMIMILVVCTLLLFNAVSASVHGRQRELSLLSCVGWTARQRAGLILLEVASVGLMAGVVGVVFSVPLARLGGIDISWPRALMAVPLALCLTTLAGLVPSIRAAGTHPAPGLAPAVARARRGRPPRGRLHLACINVIRTPGRTFMAAASLAIGVAAVVWLTGVLTAYQQSVVGTVLGDAVSVHVRSTDIAAISAILVLGVAAVADTLYLSIRERAGDIGTLRAIGWSERELRGLVLREGVVTGALGAALGLVIGVATMAWFVGEVTATLVGVAAATATGGVLLTVIAALVPVTLLGRLSPAALQAEE
nr:hypothetical protein GCM10020063_090790 [Dactylosporangium thailandense]